MEEFVEKSDEKVEIITNADRPLQWKVGGGLPLKPKSLEKNGSKDRKDAKKLTQVQDLYSPKITSQGLLEIKIRTKSSLIPLFEEILRASDADTRNGRLFLPKRCTEAYVLDISGEQRVLLMMEDTNGKDLEVYFRYWPNSNGEKMYVLEGLKEYIILMQWEAADTVTFYKREADGKLFIGFNKYHLAPKLVLKRFNLMFEIYFVVQRPV